MALFCGVVSLFFNWRNYFYQKMCIHILFGDLKKYNDKFCTCARTQTFVNQILVKESSKPLLNQQKLLTVHNLYTYFTALEILKF